MAEADAPVYEFIEWLLDTGATSHMSAFEEDFESITWFNIPIPVRVGGGRELQATGVGRVDLKVKVTTLSADGASETVTTVRQTTLRRVLFVPQLIGVRHNIGSEGH